MTVRRRVHLSVLVALLLAALGPRPAAAHGGDTGGDTGLIHACVHRASNQVRIVGPYGVCRNPEIAVHWSVSGAPAPPADGTIKGRLASCVGQDFSGTLVYVPGTSFIAIAAGDGAFAIHHVPPGTYGLVAQQPGQPGVAVKDSVTVAAGLVATVGEIQTTCLGRVQPTR